MNCDSLIYTSNFEWLSYFHIKLSDCLVHKGEILRNNIHVLKDKKLLLIICHPKIIFSFISHKSRQVCWNCRKVLKYIFVRQPVTVNLLSLFSDSYDVRETSCNATQILTYKTDNVTHDDSVSRKFPL